MKTKNNILILTGCILVFLSNAQSAQWIATDSLLLFVQLDRKNIHITFYSDNPSAAQTQTVGIPSSSGKELLLHGIRYAHRCLFAFLKIKKENYFYVLRYDLHKKEAYWQEKVPENSVNQWFVPITLRQYFDNHLYEAYRILDSSREKFFLNKKNYTPDSKHLLNYSLEWQYDFQDRKAEEILFQGVYKNRLLLNVYISEGPKKGWWLLEMDDAKGKVRNYRRITHDNDSVVQRLYFFTYDTLNRYFHLITGENFTMSGFGHNQKKIFLYKILDSSFQTVRNWTIFVNTNIKVMKQISVDKVQPLDIRIFIMNENDITFSCWGWGNKNGYYFPSAYYERLLTLDMPVQVLSANAEPLFPYTFLNMNIPPKDSIPSATPVKDFHSFFPFASDSMNYLTVIGDRNKKWFFELLPSYTATPVRKTSFVIKEKKEFNKNNSLALWKSRHYIWLVDNSENRVIFARRKKIME